MAEPELTVEEIQRLLAEGGNVLAADVVGAPDPGAPALPPAPGQEVGQFVEQAVGLPAEIPSNEELLDLPQPESDKARFVAALRQAGGATTTSPVQRQIASLSPEIDPQDVVLAGETTTAEPVADAPTAGEPSPEEVDAAEAFGFDAAKLPADELRKMAVEAGNNNMPNAANLLASAAARKEQGLLDPVVDSLQGLASAVFGDLEDAPITNEQKRAKVLAMTEKARKLDPRNETRVNRLMQQAGLFSPDEMVGVSAKADVAPTATAQAASDTATSLRRSVDDYLREARSGKGNPRLIRALMADLSRLADEDAGLVAERIVLERDKGAIGAAVHQSQAALQQKEALRLQQRAADAEAEEISNQREVDAMFQKSQAAIADFTASINDIEPKNLFETGGDKAIAGIAMALGAFGSALTGTPNAAAQSIKLLQAEIDREMSRQISVAKLKGAAAGKVGNLLTQMRAIHKDERVARQMTEATLLKSFQLQIQHKASVGAGLGANNAAEIVVNDIERMINQREQEARFAQLKRARRAGRSPLKAIKEAQEAVLRDGKIMAQELKNEMEAEELKRLRERGGPPVDEGEIAKKAVKIADQVTSLKAGQMVLDAVDASEKAFDNPATRAVQKIPGVGRLPVFDTEQDLASTELLYAGAATKARFGGHASEQDRERIERSLGVGALKGLDEKRRAITREMGVAKTKLKVLFKSASPEARRALLQRVPELIPLLQGKQPVGSVPSEEPIEE